MQDLTFDFHNNGIYLTKLPPSDKTDHREKKDKTEKSKKNASGARAVKEAGAGAGAGAGVDGTGEGAEFVHPHDRNGKLLSKRFTTRRVSFGRSVVR